jgi:hypothetical protein
VKLPVFEHKVSNKQLAEAGIWQDMLFEKQKRWGYAAGAFLICQILPASEKAAGRRKPLISNGNCQLARHARYFILK